MGWLRTPALEDNIVVGYGKELVFWEVAGMKGDEGVPLWASREPGMATFVSVSLLVHLCLLVMMAGLIADDALSRGYTTVFLLDTSQEVSFQMNPEGTAVKEELSVSQELSVPGATAENAGRAPLILDKGPIEPQLQAESAYVGAYATAAGLFQANQRAGAEAEREASWHPLDAEPRVASNERPVEIPYLLVSPAALANPAKYSGLSVEHDSSVSGYPLAVSLRNGPEREEVLSKEQAVVVPSEVASSAYSAARGDLWIPSEESDGSSDRRNLQAVPLSGEGKAEEQTNLPSQARTCVAFSLPVLMPSQGEGEVPDKHVLRIERGGVSAVPPAVDDVARAPSTSLRIASVSLRGQEERPTFLVNHQAAPRQVFSVNPASEPPALLGIGQLPPPGSSEGKSARMLELPSSKPPVEKPDSHEQVVNTPVILHQVAPVYPLAARRQGAEGTVVLLVRLDRDGSPLEVKVERSSGRGDFDRSAQDAVWKWRFEPLPNDKAWVRVRVEFRLQ